MSMHLDGQKIEPTIGSDGKYVWSINPQNPVLPRDTLSLQYIINDQTDYPADAPYLSPMKICDTKTVTYTGKNTYVGQGTQSVTLIEFSTSSTIGSSPSLQYPSVKYKFLTVDGQNPHSSQEFAVKLYDRAPQGINNIALLVDGQYKPSFSGGGDGTEWRLTLPQGTHNPTCWMV